MLSAVQKFDAKVKDSDYSDRVSLDVSIRRSKSDQFISYIVEQTAGRVAPVILDQPS